MVASDWIQLALYFFALLSLTPPLGMFIARVFNGEGTFLDRVLEPVERFIYRLAFVDRREEMDAKRYALSVLAFSGFGCLAVFALQIFQNGLPLNPQNFDGVSWALAFNTAVSFVTNTNWQAYSGEGLLSYFTQALGLTTQNFVSAATGIAVLVALIRGLTRENTRLIGNFWVDLTKSTLYILLPLSVILALLLASQGVVQNLSAYVEATTLEGATQMIPMGPAASQIAIKQLGTNGGGFFGVNSAHPFENPTPFSNFLQLLAILLIPSALVYTFGVMSNARRHALMIYVVMLTVFVGALCLSMWSEQNFGTLEGKELRFGLTNSVLWSTATTAASNGSVNAMHDSLSPLAGGAALFQILLGEIIFGGVGSGLYGVLLFVLLTVFLSGLMTGRTPEYFGKKIEAKEVQMVLLAVLVPSAFVLIGSGWSIMSNGALASLSNGGPHGLSEILYAWASAANNNGSAFAGLNANTSFFNLGLGIAMLAGRFAVLLPTLIIADSLANKTALAPSPKTMSTDSITFGVLLLFIILLVGALTFMPSLALGPVIEHFLLQAGHQF